MQIGVHNGIPPLKKDILETTIQDILRTYNASMWLAGPEPGAGNFVDSLGATPLTASNGVVGYVEDILSHEEGENYAINSTFAGGGIGVNPTGMGIIASALGITQSIVGVGSDETGPYIDVNWAGTASATAYPGVGFSSGGAFLPIVPGEIATSSCWMQLLAGAWPASSSLLCNVLNGAFSYLEQSFTGAPDYTKRFYTTSKLAVNAAAAFAAGTIQCTCTIGIPVNVTLRIWRPQINKGNLIGYIPTSGAAIPRTKNYIPAYQGTTGFKPVLTGGYRNLIPYSNFPGSVAVIPTNWGATGETGCALLATNQAESPILGSQIVRVKALTPSGVRGLQPSVLTALKTGVVYNYSCYIRFLPGVARGIIRVYLGGGTPTSVVLLSIDQVNNAPENCWIRVNADVSSSVAPTTLAWTIDSNALLPGFDVCAPQVTEGAGVLPYVANLGSNFNYSDSSPHSWKFDGTDDRLVVAKPTINPAVDHFRIVCYRNPPVAPVANSALSSTADNVNATACVRMFIIAGTFDLNAIWRDDVAVINQLAFTRAATEKTVCTMQRKSLNVEMRVRGDIGATQTGSTPVTYGAMSVSNECVATHAPAGGFGQFFGGEIYGIISGNGAPTAGELLALENFLAGCAGFTPLP